MSIHDGQAEGVNKLDNPFSVAQQETRTRDNERLGARCTRGLESLFQLFGALDLQGLDAHTQQAGGGFDFLETRRTRGDVLRREVADPREVWERLVQQFQAFAGELLRDVDDAGDIAARAGQAGDESQTHGIIARIIHDDRDGARRLFGGESPCGATDNEAVDLESDHLGNQLRKTLDLAVRKARLDDEILAFRIAQFLEALCERLVSRWCSRGRADLDVTDSIHFCRRLRVSSERRGEEDESQHHDEPNELEPHGHLLL